MKMQDDHVMLGATYHLCPQCARAVNAAAGERYCPNDGARLVTACGACGERIRTPYARYCTACGCALVPETSPRSAR